MLDLLLRRPVARAGDRAGGDRTAAGRDFHSGQYSAKQRSNRRMYSRCTHTFRRLSFGSAEICPQNASQNADSVKRWASMAIASDRTLSRFASPPSRSLVSRSSMRFKIRRRAARMMSCLES